MGVFKKDWEIRTKGKGTCEITDTVSDGLAESGLADGLVQQGQNSNENLIELHFFRALGSYSGACEIYFTKDRHPIRWAELQKKLGNIFAIHAQLEGTESTHSDLEQSIEHIENARRIFRQHNISAEIEACDRALKTLSELVEEPSDAE